MAKVQQKRATNKSARKRADKPVSDEEIRRDAEKIGAIPRQRAPGEPAPGSREDYEQWAAKRKALTSLPVTISLVEACNLVGRDLDPSQFQEQVFTILARELDVLSDLSESAESGFDVWCAFQNLTERIRLAGKIAAVIGGAE